MEKREGRVLHFDLTSEQLAEGGLICGGNIDIFLEPLREDFLDIYQERKEGRMGGGSAILATPGLWWMVISLKGKVQRY